MSHKREEQNDKDDTRYEAACGSDATYVAGTQGDALRRVRFDVGGRRDVRATVLQEGREGGCGVGKSAKTDCRRLVVCRGMMRHIHVLWVAIQSSAAVFEASQRER